MNSWAGYQTIPIAPKPGVEKSPFKIAAKRLDIDENVNTYSTFDITFYGSEFMH